MIEVDNETAIRFLRHDIYRHFAMLVTPLPQDVFADSAEPSALMHVQEFSADYVVATLTGGDDGFIEEAVNLLRSRFSSVRIISHDSRLLGALALVNAFELQPAGRVPSLVCTAIERVPEVTDPRIRRLTKADSESAKRYPTMNRNNEPSLSDMLGECDVSDIYAVVEGNETLAFLAPYGAYENIWDLDYIHVREDQRGHGLAAQLAATYARDMLAAGRIPYYSGASNPASEKTALNAGFDLCCEVFYADAARKKRCS